MKRLFIAFTCIFTFASLSAQNYSELDLIGEWNLVEGTGVYGLESLSVNNLSVVERNRDEDLGTFKAGRDYSIRDIFISSGNIIHIYIAPPFDPQGSVTRVRIIIKSLESGVLTLSSLDGNKVFSLKKKESTNVASIRAKDTNNNVYYNLQGMKVTNLSDHEVYIHNGKKYIGENAKRY